jgi:hypothetical protein
MRTVVLAALALLLFCPPTFADSSMDYALKSKRSYAAFECAALSLHGKMNETKGKQLFLLGYNEGKEFYQAIKEKKISEEDLKNIMPIAFRLVNAGPSVDFSLGMLWEKVVNEVFDDLNKDGAFDEDSIKTNASRKFWKQNCDLLLGNP